MLRYAVTKLVVLVRIILRESLRFPSDKVLCQKWISFVRKHRPNFKPSKRSALCSAYYKPTCFILVASVVSSSCAKGRALEKGSIPTRDAMVSFSS